MNNKTIVRNLLCNRNSISTFLDISLSIRKYDNSIITNFEESFKYIESCNIVEIIEVFNFESLVFSLYKQIVNGKSLLIEAKYFFENKKLTKIVETVYNNDFKNIRATISYDGTNYFGFQIQDNALTIEEVLTNSLFRITKENIKVYASGRTDAKVHALNQVINFKTKSPIPIMEWKKVFNQFLPNDIYVKSIEYVPNLFHSRYDALKKEYHYIIDTNEYNPLKANYTHFKASIDIDIVNKQLNYLIGTFDFTSFTKVDTVIKDNLRKIMKANATIKDGVITISIVGSGFLSHMVRFIVGCILDINDGKINKNINEIIQLKNREYTVNMAPANGLYLFKVMY